MKLQIQTAVKSAPRYPAIQLPARFVVGNINRDASRVGKASSVIAKKTMRKRESNVGAILLLAEVTRHFRCGAPSSLSFRVLKRTTAPGTRLRALIRLRPVPVNT
jgi:hypothetical protein